jgi:sterol 3beta-glucosyltransferase
MNISILAYGSRGDVQPFVALAVALQKAGHRPLLAAPGRFSDLTELYGVPFTPLAGDPAEISLRLNDAGQNPLKMVPAIQSYIFSIAAQGTQQALEACQGADLIIHSFLFTTGAHTFARNMGIPDISAQVFPIFAPTRAFSNLAFPANLPGRMNYFTHWLANQVFWYGGNSGYASVRKSMPGIFPDKLYWPFRTTPERPRTPLLFAWSREVFPPPPEWNENIHVTGYWPLDGQIGYQPPAGLANFLSAGQMPVCVSFGSMVNRNADRIYQAVLGALAATRQRAVFLSGWGGLQALKNSDTIFVLDAAPHDWLLPRCNAIIHHGGSGTTGAGLRAGVPNIVIPFAADQPFWGRCVASLGAGPAPIDVKNLTVNALVRMLTEAESPRIRKRAKEIGHTLQAEDGLGIAVDLIERWVERFPTLKNPNWSGNRLTSSSVCV